jgi:hypothetical protein
MCLWNGDEGSTGPWPCHSKSMGLSVPRNAMVEEEWGVVAGGRIIVVFLPVPFVGTGEEARCSGKIATENMETQMEMETSRPPRSKQTSYLI